MEALARAVMEELPCKTVTGKVQDENRNDSAIAILARNISSPAVLARNVPSPAATPLKRKRNALAGLSPGKAREGCEVSPAVPSAASSVIGAGITPPVLEFEMKQGFQCQQGKEGSRDAVHPTWIRSNMRAT